MTVKRRNHGRNKHGRGHVKRVRWDSSFGQETMIYSPFCLDTEDDSYIYFFQIISTDVRPLERPSLRIRQSSVSSSAILSMLHHSEISRRPLPTRSTNFPSSTSRCTIASKPLSINVLSAVVLGRPVGSVLLRKGNLFARTKFRRGFE